MFPSSGASLGGSAGFLRHLRALLRHVRAHHLRDHRVSRLQVRKLSSFSAKKNIGLSFFNSAVTKSVVCARTVVEMGHHLTKCFLLNHTTYLSTKTSRKVAQGPFLRSVRTLSSDTNVTICWNASSAARFSSRFFHWKLCLYSMLFETIVLVPFYIAYFVVGNISFSE